MFASMKALIVRAISLWKEAPAAKQEMSDLEYWFKRDLRERL